MLFWSANFWPNLGGLETISAELVRSLKHRGVELCVVAPVHPGLAEQSEFAGIPVHRFAFDDPRLFQDIEALFQLKRQIDKIKSDWAPDLVHVSGCSHSLLLNQLTNKQKIPLLVTLHGGVPGSQAGETSIYEQALRSANWICCCSEWTRAGLLRMLPECRPLSSTILNALPLPMVIPKARPRGSSYVLCAGRLSPEKGFETAVEALTQVDPEIFLHFAGEGKMRKPLQQLASQLGVENRVKFLGRLQPEDLYQEMRDSLAVLVPSIEEGFGLVALEAAWMGVPVIATRVGGLPEVVRHDETGWLVNVHHSAEMAEAIQRLKSNPEWAGRIGEQAYQWARQFFCWSDFVSAYLTRYQLLLEGSKGCE